MKHSLATIRTGVFCGVDLNALVHRFWRLDAMHAIKPHPLFTPPDVRFRAYAWTSASGADVTGKAFPAFRHITLCIGEKALPERVVESLLHEVVHCACPLREDHGEFFCRRLIACAREAFALDLGSDDALLTLAPVRGARAYAIDDVIEKALIQAKTFSKPELLTRRQGSCA